MRTYTVQLRTTVHVDAETREEAGEIARFAMARGWSNMALGHPAIVRGDSREFVVANVRPKRRINLDGSLDTPTNIE